MIFILLCILVVVVGPIWIIMHYSMMMKRSKSITSEDEKLLEELLDATERMSSRIGSLEKILDRDDKDWRRTHDDRRLED